MSQLVDDLTAARNHLARVGLFKGDWSRVNKTRSMLPLRTRPTHPAARLRSLYSVILPLVRLGQRYSALRAPFRLGRSANTGAFGPHLGIGKAKVLAVFDEAIEDAS